MSQSTQIKAKLKEKLDALVPTTLAVVVVDDFAPNIAEKDLGGYPAAILSTPTVNSDRLTNRENERLYTFEVLIVSKGEDVNTSDKIETLMDAIINDLDSNSTLDGVAIAMDPVTVPTAPVSTPDRSKILFSILIPVRAIANADC